MSEINETTDADIALQTWGQWMFNNRDRGTGVSWYTIQPFERLRQPSGGDPDFLPDMPPLVQAVDEIVHTLPASHRTAAKVWWITFGCTGEQGAANLVGNLLHMRVGRWTFKAMIEFVRGYVAAKLD